MKVKGPAYGTRHSCGQSQVNL